MADNNNVKRSVYTQVTCMGDLVLRALPVFNGNRFRMHAVVCKAARRLHYPNTRMQSTIVNVLRRAVDGQDIGELTGEIKWKTLKVKKLLKNG